MPDHAEALELSRACYNRVGSTKFAATTTPVPANQHAHPGAVFSLCLTTWPPVFWQNFRACGGPQGRATRAGAT